MERLSCSGTELSITECSKTLGLHSCSHADDASVRCIGKNVELFLHAQII